MKCFNQRLLNRTQKFTSDLDYLSHSASRIVSKGTPSYWKKFLRDVLTTFGKLGPSNFFQHYLLILTLSYFSIASKLNRQKLSNEDVINLSYYDRCRLLNRNPALVAR